MKTGSIWPTSVRANIWHAKWKTIFLALAPSKPRVILTHGEDHQRRILRGLIHERLGLRSEMPDYLETIEV